VAWAKIVRRVRHTQGCNENTLVFKYTNKDGSSADVKSASLIIQLRCTASKIGYTTLGYAPHEIGTHSIRSGAAMALVLSGHQAWRIMRKGRWRSSAFLLYIREQVQAFSKGVSDRMIKNPDFFHVPDIGRASSSCDMLNVSFLG
jgi:hypothetical protein